MHENIACWDKKCRKNLRVSHDTTLSIYDDIVQNRCILPLLMILTKLLIKSIMWPFINDGLKLLLLSNIITIAGHAWAILSSQTFQHQPRSGSDHHTGSMAIFRQIFGVSHGSNGL